MKHEDFNSIEIDDVLTKVIDYCQQQTQAKAVHWISAYGLKRVQSANGDQDWQWAFAAADVIGRHMWSTPASDLWQLFQMWGQVSELYPEPWNKCLPPHLLSLPHPRFAYPVFFEDRLLGVMVLDRPKASNPVEIMRLFKAGLDVAVRYLHFAYLHLDAKNESYIDELTGLYNQRYLPMALEHEIQRAKRDKSEFTLLFLDIDYFKMVNDGRGHWVGSKLLMEIGKVLRDQVRSCDYTFRYGGDEFIIILGGSALESSRAVAERIRKVVESKTFQVESHSLNLTVSIGLASYPQHANSAPSLIQIADQAMYYGKRKSRNIVFVAS